MPNNVEPLVITQNETTYTAEEGHGYSPVTVNVDVGIEPDDFADLSVKTAVTGDITLSKATKITRFSFYNFTGITSIDAPYATSLEESCLTGCSALTSVNFPRVTSVAIGQFKGLSNLVTANLPAITRNIQSKQEIFRACTKLKNVDLSSIESIYSQSMFYGCTELETIVFPNTGLFYGTAQSNNNTRFGANMFYGCAKLKAVDVRTCRFDETNCFKNCTVFDTLIIRELNNNLNTIPALSNINNFDGTPFASDGSGGTLYVPSRYISRYQAATNWSTILGYENNQILPIEGSYYETHYADGTLLPIYTYTEMNFPKRNKIDYTDTGGYETWDTRYWGTDGYIDLNGAKKIQFSFESTNTTFPSGYLTIQMFKNTEFLGVSTNHYYGSRVINGSTYYTCDIEFPDECTRFRLSMAYGTKDTAKLYIVTEEA